jgi:hypothetical protein
VGNVLGATYWSTVPYLFGKESFGAVKYRAIPCTDEFQRLPGLSANFLRDRLRQSLASNKGCYYFGVQAQVLLR